ncbi:hypothetical protein BJX70DRAFT_376135 [Aspergillus crustosus]
MFVCVDMWSSCERSPSCRARTASGCEDQSAVDRWAIINGGGIFSNSGVTYIVSMLFSHNLRFGMIEDRYC